MATKRSKKRVSRKGFRGEGSSDAKIFAGVAGTAGAALAGHSVLNGVESRAADRSASARRVTSQAATGGRKSGPVSGVRRSGAVKFPPSTYQPPATPTQGEMFPTARPAPVVPETPVSFRPQQGPMVGQPGMLQGPQLPPGTVTSNLPVRATSTDLVRGNPNFEFAPRQSGFTGGNPGAMSGEPLGVRMSGDPLTNGVRPPRAVSAAQNAVVIPETPVSLSNRVPASGSIPEFNNIPKSQFAPGPSSAYPQVAQSVPRVGPPLPPAGTAPPANFGMNLNNPGMRNSSAGGEVFNIAEGQAAAKGGVWQAMKGGGLNPLLRTAGMGAGGAAIATQAGGIGAFILGNKIVDSMNVGGENSYLDKGLSGLAGGAASGAVYGGGYGALAGGLIGGAFGVGSKYFGDKASAPQEAQGTFQDYAAFGTQYGVPADTMNQLQQQYTAAVQLGTIANGDDEAGMAASEAAALESYGTAIATAVQGQLSGTSQQASGDASNAALQAVMTKYVQPYADQQIATSQAYADSLDQYASQNPNLAPVLRNQAAAERANGTRMAASLMASARIEPYMQAAQNQQSTLAQQAQQIAAQAMQPQQQSAALSPSGM